MTVQEGKTGLAGLEGVEVAITGRLASMRRDEARERIHAAGGRYVASPSEATGLLIVGQGGPVLGEDGMLTASLREAHALRERGVEIEILSEELFLGRLGLEERQGDLHRLYTLAQLARILDVPVRRVRSWMRHDLIRPAKVVKRLCFFEFAQVATAKALSQLAKDGITPTRIRRSLEELGEWLPGADSALAQLELIERDGPLLIRTAEGLAETSGQLRLDFDDDAPAAGSQPDPRAVPAVRRNAEEWFELGVAAEEEGMLDEAVAAYTKSLEIGGAQPEVCFNLGNALFALERGPDAADLLEQAIELDPDYVEAWNNLGVVLGENGRLREAVSSFRRALALERAYADAHYNLAETLAQLEDLEGARRHWLSYLDLDPLSSWADQVRERLRINGLSDAP